MGERKWICINTSFSLGVECLMCSKSNFSIFVDARSFSSNDSGSLFERCWIYQMQTLPLILRILESCFWIEDLGHHYFFCWWVFDIGCQYAKALVYRWLVLNCAVASIFEGAYFLFLSWVWNIWRIQLILHQVSHFMELKQWRKWKDYRVWEQKHWRNPAKPQKVEMERSDVQFRVKAAGGIGIVSWELHKIFLISFWARLHLRTSWGLHQFVQPILLFMMPNSVHGRCKVLISL